MVCGVSSLIHKRKSVDSKQAISMKFLPGDRIIRASHTLTILEALEEAGIPMESSCGGMGTCGTCRIVVEKGLDKLGPRNEPEREIAVDRGFSENERLSCQNFSKEGLVLRRGSA